ncbi:hypothetical protein CDD80_3273 [Ophiocordyceps camponoti-rufipedis]|uniref:hydroxyethylthiazole kinase n=1 Tax=Ophiocordyceps camponoti-rufipedis TaxID=2004952 RepID=A0A2C5Y7Y6_9HYPO|nr:hypothetical protein CDD80_3273 [Ophiocordyceps camponoti-rufipedis]
MAKPVDYSLYLVTHPIPSLEAIVESAIQGGATIVQLRDKTSPRPDVASTAHRLLAITRRHGVPLLINDDVRLAVETDSRCQLGPSGVASILAALVTAGHGSIPTVCIGGLDASNAARVLSSSRTPTKMLSGIAVVRAILHAPDPGVAAGKLWATVLAARVAGVMSRVIIQRPLSHNMTNLLEALEAYNAAGRPVVLDPVGVGATTFRREVVDALLSSGRFTVIKGNASEMLALDNSPSPRQQQGVDSTASLPPSTLAALTQRLALRHACTIVLTGPTDYISDGRVTVRLENGHEMLSAVTGSGCALGAILAATLSVSGDDVLLAAVAAVSVLNVAAEVVEHNVSII